MIQLEAPKDLWPKELPKNAKGDPTESEIHTAVGMALSEWEGSELAFAKLFAILVESHSLASLRAYGAITSNNGRCDALEQASQVFFRRHGIAKADRDDFDTLLVHYRKAQTVRNAIAHGIVTDYYDRGHYLLPPDYNSKGTYFEPRQFEGKTRVSFKTKYALTGAQISEIASRFVKLKLAVLEYCGRVGGKLFEGMPVAPDNV